MTRFIVFTSGKGGVGKTTMATNVAAALHKYGKQVLLVDANVTTPNVSILLGMPKLPVTLHDVLAKKSKIREAIYIHPSGLKVLPAGLSMKDMKKKKKLEIAEALNDIIGDFDYVIIDSAAGLGNEAKLAIEAGDEVIIVTNPEIHALTDALKAIEFAKEHGVYPTGVILNRVSGKKYEMDVDNVEKFLEVKVIGLVPEDEHVKKSIAEKRPVVYLYPKAPASRAIKRIAAKIAGEDYRTLEGETVFEKLLKLFGVTY